MRPPHPSAAGGQSSGAKRRATCDRELLVDLPAERTLTVVGQCTGELDGRCVLHGNDATRLLWVRGGAMSRVVLRNLQLLHANATDGRGGAAVRFQPHVPTAQVRPSPLPPCLSCTAWRLLAPGGGSPHQDTPAPHAHSILHAPAVHPAPSTQHRLRRRRRRGGGQLHVVQCRLAHNTAAVRAKHYYYDTVRQDWEYRQAEAGGAAVFVTYGTLVVNGSVLEHNHVAPRANANATDDQTVGGGAITVKGGQVRSLPRTRGLRRRRCGD